MLKIAIIIGSTRPGRNGEAVGKWAYDVARKRDDGHEPIKELEDLQST